MLEPVNKAHANPSITSFSVPQRGLHHIGFVVPAIQNAVHPIAESIGATWHGEIIHDPNQAVRVTFLHSKHPSEPLVELIEPATETSPVKSFLSKGGGLHHLCYLTDNLERQLELSRLSGGLVTRPPLPAVAFGGRRIAFVYTKSKLLVEYLERILCPAH
jgi:methylmalonyl-CoA/ethylmalonyl-CoA epimerase